MLLNINLLTQVRLRKDGERVSCNAPIADTRLDAAHKVRHGLETPRRDPLQRLARLESDAVARDLDLERLPRARLDVQAGARVRRCGELRERGQRGAVRHGHTRVCFLFVNEHGRRQTSQASMVEVRGAPVILVAVGIRIFLALWVVVQQSSLCRVGCADDMLEVALGVALNLLFCEAIAGARNEDGDVDNEAAEIGHGWLKSR